MIAAPQSLRSRLRSSAVGEHARLCALRRGRSCLIVSTNIFAYVGAQCRNFNSPPRVNIRPNGTPLGFSGRFKVFSRHLVTCLRPNSLYFSFSVGFKIDVSYVSRSLSVSSYAPYLGRLWSNVPVSEWNRASNHVQRTPKCEPIGIQIRFRKKYRFNIHILDKFPDFVF